jgi:hypothetical protein
VQDEVALVALDFLQRECHGFRFPGGAAGQRGVCRRLCYVARPQPGSLARGAVASAALPGPTRVMVGSDQGP